MRDWLDLIMKFMALALFMSGAIVSLFIDSESVAAWATMLWGFIWMAEIRIVEEIKAK